MSRFFFDTSQGTNHQTCRGPCAGRFSRELAGTFHAAADATIQFGGGTRNAPLVPGTPLVLGGSGQYQFISGYFISAGEIPNLSLQGGVLELGAGFQGGAITNLTLDGIAFTNQFPATLPIRGTFTIINSGTPGSIESTQRYVGGSMERVSMGIIRWLAVTCFSMSNAAMYGGVAVTSV